MQIKQLVIIAAVLIMNATAFAQQPLDGIVERKNIQTKRILDYSPINERDVMWSKTVYRVIDVREKMNLPFMNPKAPFFELLTNAAIEKKIKLYSVEADNFSVELTDEDLQDVLFSVDTIERFDPVTYKSEFIPVSDAIFYEDVKRFRIKEIWYMNSKTSTMNVRVLGIAPLLDNFDENGNFLYEKPLFWAYMPAARKVLARHQVFNAGNDMSPMSWADIFEMRLFSSHVYKSSDVLNRRLQEMYTGLDLLREGEKIESEIQNMEMDLWSN